MFFTAAFGFQLLAVHSDVFKAMLFGSFKEVFSSNILYGFQAKEDRIEMTNVSVETFDLLLRIIYGKNIRPGFLTQDASTITIVGFFFDLAIFFQNNPYVCDVCYSHGKLNQFEEFLKGFIFFIGYFTFQRFGKIFRRF